MIGWGRKKTHPEKILDEGWQFEHTPNTLYPPGTIFRLDSDNRRYRAGTLDVKSTLSNEHGKRIVRQADKGIGILTKLLDIGVKANAKVESNEKIIFELPNSEIQVTDDLDVDKVLKPFIEKLDFRPKSRYFLVRESRWTSEMIYHISKNRVIELGGEANITDNLNIKGKLKFDNENLFEIPQEFSEKMIIMFLPEEIKETTSSLGGKSLLL